MSMPLEGLTQVPLLNSQTKRVIIELHATPVLDQYTLQVHKHGLDDKGWDFVHMVLMNAAHTVANEWVKTSLGVWQRPQLVLGRVD